MALHQHMPVLLCSNQYFTLQTTKKVHGNTAYLNPDFTHTHEAVNTWIIELQQEREMDRGNSFNDPDNCKDLYNVVGR